VSEPAAAVPAGWFPDPGGEPQWRWWDGREWTQYATAPSSPGHRAVPDAVAAEQRVLPWARWAVVVYALGAALACLSSLLYPDVLRQELHYVRLVFDNVGQPPGLVPVAPTQPAGYRSLELVTLVLVVTGEIVFLNWQHRAATTARHLGYPARISPGWGVVFWFVPVANLVLPYEAIRDCLPPGHPARPQVLRSWLALVTALLLSILAAVSAAFVRPLGIGLGVLAIGAFAVYAVTMRHLVPAIGTEHRLAGEWLAGR